MMKEKELATVVADGINNLCFDYNAFCRAMCNEHRALQSDFTTLCIKWLETCADDKYGYDSRNEWAHTLAKKIVEVLP